MCLAVPGKVVEIEADDGGLLMGRVQFGEIKRRVSLACVSDVRIGDYVVVHVGFAISRIDEAEALRVFETLREMGELSDLDLPGADRA
jgi:hydrogenase expression/formation protein HypC